MLGVWGSHPIFQSLALWLWRCIISTWMNAWQKTYLFFRATLAPTSSCHDDVPPVEFMYLLFTCMPGESYRMWLWSLLLYLCQAFWIWVLINCLVCWFVLSVLSHVQQMDRVLAKTAEYIHCVWDWDWEVHQILWDPPPKSTIWSSMMYIICRLHEVHLTWFAVFCFCRSGQRMYTCPLLEQAQRLLKAPTHFMPKAPPPFPVLFSWFGSCSGSKHHNCCNIHFLSFTIWINHKRQHSQLQN